MWPLYERLHIFFAFYWPHLSLKKDLPWLSACFQLPRHFSFVKNQYSPLVVHTSPAVGLYEVKLLLLENRS